MDAVYPLLGYWLALVLTGAGLYAFSYWRNWRFEGEPYYGYWWAIKSQARTILPFLDNPKLAEELIAEVFNEAQAGYRPQWPESHQLLASYWRWRQLNQFAFYYSATTSACLMFLILGVALT